MKLFVNKKGEYKVGRYTLLNLIDVNFNYNFKLYPQIQGFISSISFYKNMHPLFKNGYL